MYKIIGADGKEYGPVSTEQLRQWIAEGRVNAQTLAQVAGSAEWLPLGQLTEFAALLAAPPPLPGAAGAATSPPPPARAATTLDIGDCLNRSWELLKAHFGPIVGATTLVCLLLGIGGVGLRVGTNLAFGITLTDIAQTHGIEMFRLQWPGILVSTMWYWLMTGPLIGGLYSFYLKLIRGQPATMADAFAGFGPPFVQLVLGSLCVSFLTTIGLCLCLIPGFYLSVAWRFTLPAIIDKRLGFPDAMKLSRRLVTGRWWPMFALVLLSGLIAAAGLLACCIGVFVTAPIAIGAILYAYEDLLGIQLAAS
jgi:hypothetical protein